MGNKLKKTLSLDVFVTFKLCIFVIVEKRFGHSHKDCCNSCDLILSNLFITGNN